MEPTGDQKGANRRTNCKNCHGALVGLTWVKGTSVDTFFYVYEKNWKMCFLALVGLTLVRGRSVRKKDAESDEKGGDTCNIF